MPADRPRTYEPKLREYFIFTGALSSLAMEDKARRGEFPGCPPVGYRIPSDGWPRIPEPDPALAPLVREAFRLAADGMSLRRILKELLPRGLVSRTGKPMGVSALWAVLTNPFYTGKMRYKGDVLPGRHEPIVNDALFERVQDRLSRAGAKASRIC